MLIALISCLKTWGFCFVLVFGISAFVTNANAGKYPRAELTEKIVYGVVEILKKHGMPVEHNHAGNHWFADDGRPGHYTIIFSRADEIPQQAVLDTITFCMDMYQEQGFEEELVRIRILMFKETMEEQRESRYLLFGGGWSLFSN